MLSIALKKKWCFFDLYCRGVGLALKCYVYYIMYKFENVKGEVPFYAISKHITFQHCRND
jgi:hypothetical protein